MALLKNLATFFFGREEEIFTLFEKKMTIVSKAASCLKVALERDVSREILENSIKLKKESFQIYKEIFGYLNRTLMPPIDREDLQEINSDLNRLVKRLAKIVFMLRIYKLTDLSAFVRKQINLLLEAVIILQSIFKGFRATKKIADLSEKHEQMEQLELKGDQVFAEATKDLFTGNYQFLTLVKYRDIQSGLEKALDLCFSLADIILNVALKHI